MTHKPHKLLAARAATPAPGAEQVRMTGRLPDEMVDEQVQRLAVFSAVAAGLWALTVVVHTFITPRTVGTIVPRRGIAIEALGVVISIAVFLYVRYAPHTCQKKSDAGLWFMVLNTILNALLTTWVTPPTVETMGRLSWTTIIILISAMIVPSTPRKMLAASLAAASMEPLGV